MLMSSPAPVLDQFLDRIALVEAAAPKIACRSRRPRRR